MASVRRQDGFVRYAFAVTYHGGYSLGFSYQAHENALLSDGTDLRGLYSIEGRIRRALSALVGDTAVQPLSPNNDVITDNQMKEYNFENFQVSSRTDRGVHALKSKYSFLRKIKFCLRYMYIPTIIKIPFM
jgi:tRNA U38,U39,U40 pseudouridine synthase TruA